MTPKKTRVETLDPGLARQLYFINQNSLRGKVTIGPSKRKTKNIVIYRQQLTCNYCGRIFHKQFGLAIHKSEFHKEDLKKALGKISQRNRKDFKVGKKYKRYKDSSSSSDDDDDDDEDLFTESDYTSDEIVKDTKRNFDTKEKKSLIVTYDMSTAIAFASLDEFKPALTLKDVYENSAVETSLDLPDKNLMVEYHNRRSLQITTDKRNSETNDQIHSDDNDVFLDANLFDVECISLNDDDDVDFITSSVPKTNQLSGATNANDNTTSATSTEDNLKKTILTDKNEKDLQQKDKLNCVPNANTKNRESRNVKVTEQQFDQVSVVVNEDDNLKMSSSMDENDTDLHQSRFSNDNIKGRTNDNDKVHLRGDLLLSTADDCITESTSMSVTDHQQDQLSSLASNADDNIKDSSTTNVLATKNFQDQRSRSMKQANFDGKCSKHNKAMEIQTFDLSSALLISKMNIFQPTLNIDDVMKNNETSNDVMKNNVGNLSIGPNTTKHQKNKRENLKPENNSEVINLDSKNRSEPLSRTVKQAKIDGKCSEHNEAMEIQTFDLASALLISKMNIFQPTLNIDNLMKNNEKSNDVMKNNVGNSSIGPNTIQHRKNKSEKSKPENKNKNSEVINLDSKNKSQVETEQDVLSKTKIDNHKMIQDDGMRNSAQTINESKLDSQRQNSTLTVEEEFSKSKSKLSRDSKSILKSASKEKNLKQRRSLQLGGGLSGCSNVSPTKRQRTEETLQQNQQNSLTEEINFDARKLEEQKDTSSIKKNQTPMEAVIIRMNNESSIRHSPASKSNYSQISNQTVIDNESSIRHSPTGPKSNDSQTVIDNESSISHSTTGSKSDASQISNSEASKLDEVLSKIDSEIEELMKKKEYLSSLKQKSTHSKIEIETQAATKTSSASFQKSDDKNETEENKRSIGMVRLTAGMTWEKKSPGNLNVNIDQYSDDEIIILE